MSEKEILRRFMRLLELFAIAQGDTSTENRRTLFEFLTSDELLVGTRKRIEQYTATAPEICLADPPARTQRLN
ncbi:MAG: hypothetical protein ACHQ01_09600 [Candidatus Limnocylindrales bacterium]